MSDIPLLGNYKHENDLSNQKVYVIQFPNPFDTSYENLNETITYRTARKQMFKIFKTSLKYQRPFDKPLGNAPELEAQTSLSQDNSSKKQMNVEAVPEMVKKRVTWLYNDDSGDLKMTKREFLKAVISSVLFTIEYELNLKYSLLQSRDRDEIFCEIYADETWLENKAQSVGYRLQFRQEKSDLAEIKKFPFKAIPPFAKFEVPTIFKEARNIFKHYDKDEKETDHGGSLFTYNDRVRLILSSLNTRLDLHIMKEYELSLEDFCLHSETPLTELKQSWGNFSGLFKAQPLDSIRNYFGEKIALYFAWMEMYKNFMISAGIIGLGVQIFVMLRYFDNGDKALSQYLQVFFALFLAFWASAFDQLWTRKQKFLAWRWGTTNFYEEEEQRGEFKGKMDRDPVSNKMKRKRIGKIWYAIRKLVSYSVLSVLIVSVLAIILGIMAARIILKNLIFEVGLVLAGVINALQIRIMNLIYDKIATWLNDWENHETETEYNNRLAIKVFIFRFFNSYSSLFYLAYYCEEAQSGQGYESCMDFLGLQLAVIFFFSIILNVIEISVPYLLMKKRLISEDFKLEELRKTDNTLRVNLYPVEREAKRESYESPLFDYIEMIIEFGYVALFGTSLPILPLFLLFEIVFEIRVDAWKICNIYKRADPHRSEDIGVFRDIILIMAYAGAINNSGLIIFTSGVLDNFLKEIYDPSFILTNFHYLVAFVVLEHILIVGMFLISIMIAENPEVVEKGLIWSERIINERLYKTSSAIKFNFMKNLIENAIEENRKNEEFLLVEDELNYTENNH